MVVLGGGVVSYKRGTPVAPTAPIALVHYQPEFVAKATPPQKLSTTESGTPIGDFVLPSQTLST